MAKRANGEGSISKRADGRYHAAAYVYRPDGTRTRKFVYGKTRKEVADKLTELQEKTRQGIPAAESTMAFGDYLTYWLATIAPQRLKPSTLNSYEGLARLYIRPALGKKRLNRLSPADVRRFLADFKDSCLCCLRGADKERPEEKRSCCCAVGRCCQRRPSARTVQYIHAVLRSSLQQAIREELIARNVARIVETPTVTRKEVRPLDAAEARLMLKTAQSHRLYALWLLLVSTGLRRGEALALTWTDIDLTNGQLRVRRNVQRIRRELIFGTQDHAIHPHGLSAEALHAGTCLAPNPAGAGTQGRGEEVAARARTTGRSDLHYDARSDHRPPQPEQDAHHPVPGRRRATGAGARPPAHMRLTAARAGRGRSHDHGNARA
jgi:integrase